MVNVMTVSVRGKRLPILGHVRVIVFSKPVGSMSVTELADSMAELGVDGVDLVVRDGQTVTPENPDGILAVARALAERGLSLEVVTTSFTEPDEPAEAIFDACAEAGVRLVRAGFFRYDPAQGYQRSLAAAQRGLAELAGIAADSGVPLAVQLHHGTIHQSAAHVLRLISDLDEVRVYADFGNQAKEGSEDWQLTLDLLGDRLACVGVKTAAWHRALDGWRPDWVPLSAEDGVVPWPAILPGLGERGYDGPLSLHMFYPTPDPLAALRADLDYLRALPGFS
jgi:sugar phosphate isomerase/epimerase